MSNAEEGIMRAQTAAIKARGTQGKQLQEHHQRSAAYLDERILTAILALAIMGLIVVWATATSPLILYGSFAGVILLTIVWGISSVRRIERKRQQRKHQASDWKSENTE